MALTISQCPYTGPYSVEGYGRHKGNTALALKRAMARLGFLVWDPANWDQFFNARLEAALDKWDPGKNGYGEGRWVKIRSARVPVGRPNAGEYALDAIALKLIKAEALQLAIKVPALGPVFNGGKSVLMHDLTHPSGGLPTLPTGKSLWPAFDDAYAAGTSIIAPENMTIYDDSSSSPGDACYARGESKIKYWIAHLVLAPPVGRELDKGDYIGKVINTSKGGGPHTHFGINVEGIWGSGRHLIYKDNYQHGGPLIGAQLEEGP